jgi:oligoendopeptidase F
LTRKELFVTTQETDRATSQAPTWDLSDLYAGGDDPAIARDLDAADTAAEELDARYRGRVAHLDAAALGSCLGAYEAVRELAGKIGSFAYLNWAANTADAPRGALLQRATERGSRLSQKLVFLELELAHASDEAAADWLADPILGRYRHWLEQIRRFRPHLLTEAEEVILAEKEVTGRSAWDRFFDELHGAARYELDGQALARDQALTRLYSPDRNLRKRAADTVTATLRGMQQASTYVFNTILADKASDDRLRHYESWISERNLANQVEDRTVEALIEAVTSRYDIVERYYRLKRRLLGLDTLDDYDRYAPLPAAELSYTWDEARQIVLDAYNRFHPNMAEVASLFFERGWIDAAARPAKMGGAFSHPVVPSVHPYVLVNYDGKPRDVMTLAHELGHGVHQKVSGIQGLLQHRTPLTTAETASVFGEMLVFQDLMAKEADPHARLAMLTTKIEDSFATAFRQIAMNRFEDAIHTHRRTSGELSTEQFSELWLASQRAMFGGSVTLREEYGIWWSYVHHFTGAPGYVYAYAFGELLVLALYARYQEAGPTFAPAYMAMLTAGGSDWPHDLVRPLGVDLTDPGFWHQGLRILDEMVAEAERLAEGRS